MAARNAWNSRETRKLVRWVAVAILAAVAGYLQKHDGGDSYQRRPSAQIPEKGSVDGYPKLTDGDSFRMNGTEVRMVDIDAPEGKQMCQRDGRDWPCGEEARRKLSGLIGGQQVNCRAQEIDQHGRLLGTCYVGTRNLNLEMVASGFAVAFSNRYKREEDQARRGSLGLWSGQFQRPQDWRHANGIGGR
jgi:endonuclease YncB( thermonuclease family)